MKVAISIVFFTSGVLLALLLRTAVSFLWNNLELGQVSGVSADWPWILALLAFPLLFILFAGNKGEPERIDYHRDTDLAGIKGGRTHRDSILGDEDDEE